MTVTKRKAKNKPVASGITLDHDVVIRDDNGKVKDLVKRHSDVPRPHADGCVGCRRESVCIFCSEPCILGESRCVAGACYDCCEGEHQAHNVVYKVVFVPTREP